MIPIRTRASVWGDVEAICEIERTCPRPWSLNDVGRARRQPGAYCVVATLASQVAGYAVFRLDAHGINLDRIAVHAALRRHRVGRVLMRRIERSLSRDRPTITAIVPDDLLECHLFLRAMRFRALAVKPGAFEDADGYCFVRMVSVAQGLGA